MTRKLLAGTTAIALALSPLAPASLWAASEGETLLPQGTQQAQESEKNQGTAPEAPATTEPAATEQAAPAATEEAGPTVTEGAAPAATEQADPAVAEEVALEPANPGKAKGKKKKAEEAEAAAATQEPEPAATTEQAAPAATEESAPATTEQSAPAATEQAAPAATAASEPAVPAEETDKQRRERKKAERAEARAKAEAEAAAQQPPAAAAAAAPTDGSAPAAQPTVTTETVTQETTRTSNEEVEQATDERRKKKRGDKDDDLLKILGAAGGGLAAGVIIGSILNDGSEVVGNTGDRVIVERDGQYFVRKDENEILRRPGSEVQTQTYSDGSSRTVVERADGTRVETIRDQNGYVVRRTRVLPDGREILLFDDTQPPVRGRPIETTALPPAYVETLPQARYVDYSHANRQQLRDTLMAQPATELDRSFSLRQVRENREVRDLMPGLDLDTITFASGSAAITPDQARYLDALGRAMEEILLDNPDEVFLIEGHTDAVGSALSNLALSDRRAETVALALTEYYDIPPENLFTQGYGEEFLKIRTEASERANRRATVRRITQLLDRMAQRQ